MAARKFSESRSETLWGVLTIAVLLVLVALYVGAWAWVLSPATDSQVLVGIGPLMLPMKGWAILMLSIPAMYVMAFVYAMIKDRRHHT